MVEHELLTNDFIGGWYTSTNLCQRIVDKCDHDSTSFSHDEPRQYSWADLGEFDDNLCEEYCEQLINTIQHYTHKYPKSVQHIKPWGFTRPRIQVYKPNDAYSVAHCENDGYPEHAQRHLSYMTYLTTIKDGGGTMFTQQDVVTPSNAGLTVIWPAGWTHYHHGVPAPTETKYIITGWCCY